MNAFEMVVAGLLEKEGYWVRMTFKIELTKEEKVEIGLPSSPRWEIDLVAYSPRKKEILAVECKSFLDSPGVRLTGVTGENAQWAKKYKLFANPVLRRVVLERMKKQMVEDGLCSKEDTVRLCLVAGKIAGGKEDSAALKRHFEEQGWLLRDADWIWRAFKDASESPYEDSIASVVAKLIHRNAGFIGEGQA